MPLRRQTETEGELWFVMQAQTDTNNYNFMVLTAVLSLRHKTQYILDNQVTF